ncbi:MAG: TetR/AcrR family transcriptional regulator C-terminal domain-containing protein [Paracoccaceae bacterium]
MELGDDWRDWLRQLFYRYRKAMAAHPNVAPLLGAQLVSNAGVSPILVERLLTVLEGAGFLGEELINTYNACLAALLGNVTPEFAPAPADKPDDRGDDLRERLSNLSEEHYPHIRKNLDRLANRAFVLRWQSGAEVPLSDGFAVYVETFISGLDTRSRAGPTKPEAGNPAH